MRPFLLLTALALPALAFAQGTLTPPAGAFSGAAPTATMKTLDQVEPRTPVRAGAPGVTQNANGGFTISASGSYYLTGNLTVASGNAINIVSNNVTLDLAGFTILSTSTPYAGTAIDVASTAQINVTIRNGQIAGNITFADSGTASGSGFANGIVAESTQNCTVLEVNIGGAGDRGISLNTNNNSLIARCTAQNCRTGLTACFVSDSSVRSLSVGICGSILTNCHARVTMSSAIDAFQNANNCFGVSTSGSGIATDNATNCWGVSESGAAGLKASKATNCTGGSDSGTGLTATTATNCTGSSDSGTGLFADNAANCAGISNSGTGLDTNSELNDYTGTATGCTGISQSGHGLIAAVATNCTGRTTDKSKIAVWVSGTATSCRATNTGATGTGAQSAITCTIAVACTATTGTINAGSKQLGTP